MLLSDNNMYNPDLTDEFDFTDWFMKTFMQPI